ncbi:MAG: AraC family transcriptional regulator [Halioglobus sp.]
MTVFAPALSSLWRQIVDAGLDPEPLFAKHGVGKDEIFDSGARVAYSLVDSLEAEVRSLVDDPFFGIREAEYFRPAHIGPLGFAWLASTNLNEALKRLQRYAKVINDHLEIDVNCNDEVITVTMTDVGPSADTYQRDLGSLAVLVRMCRFLCGDKWNPLGVSIAHDEPADTSYFFSYFRCPVIFGAASNHVLLDAVQAQERITGADEHLAQLNDHIVVRYLAQRSKEDVVSRARVAILDSLGDGGATEASVAETLHISSRQLNRKLHDENTSFRALLMQSRLELAEQYINDSTLSLTEISYLLGFSEASSFSRAFRRWTGVSPTQARAADGGSGHIP